MNSIKSLVAASQEKFDLTSQLDQKRLMGLTDRLLDSKTGRSVKTVNNDQLLQMFEQQVNCSKDCGNMSCQNRTFED